VLGWAQAQACTGRRAQGGAHLIVAGPLARSQALERGVGVRAGRGTGEEVGA
jgi:hypothetical protein